MSLFIGWSQCSGQNNNCNPLCNGDFEDSMVVSPGNYLLVHQNRVPSWKTTEPDSIIEVWGSGFLGVPAYSGNQFIELNAYAPATIYQDFQAVPGSTLTISFAHRGRDGVDVMSVSIGPVNGPFTTLGVFSNGNSSWSYDSLLYKLPVNGLTGYSIRFSSISAAGGNPAIGNFLDAVSITNSLISQDDNIINSYTPVLSLETCSNKIAVEDGSSFNIGDTILIIQMKGVVIDSSNTSNFGTITDYKNSGNYEFNYVKNKAGNNIELKNNLTRGYDIPNGKVQLIRVPWYQNINITSTLTCLPWDGNKGGVLVLNVKDTVTLNADIDVSNKGYKGGIAKIGYGQCNIDSFYIIENNGINGAAKGEGIFLNTRLYNGRGKVANGGGGGNNVNSGGAGGGNGGNGGEGGKEWAGCSNNFINGGLGGLQLNYNNTANRIYAGGGGGAGHMNDSYLAKGGNGGGIAIIISGFLKSNSNSIKANGETPEHIVGNADDGRSGGGAGGTILINYGSLIGTATITANGGNGDFCIAIPNYYHGPGGGGGGGIIWINKATSDPLLNTSVSGGLPGTNVNIGNNPWGATAGAKGNNLLDLIIPVDNTFFTPSPSTQFIDTSICKGQNYAGYTIGGIYIDTVVNANGCSVRTINLKIKPVSFSSVTQSICEGQNYSGHNTSGIYIDTLVATNGCDSIRTLHLSVKPRSGFSITQMICYGQTYLGHSAAGTYIDTLIASNGCDSIQTLQLIVLPKPSTYLGADTTLCNGDSLKLYPGQFTTYSWQDGSAQSHFTVKQPGLYSVVVTNNCGTARDEIIIKEGICDIYFPTAFTPNNDGKNDQFKILGAININNYHLLVYNRWGQKVFETNDAAKGWTGSFKGQLQETGVYVWRCNFKRSGIDRYMKGIVVLLR